MVLKHLSKVVVQFSPLSGNGRTAREFLARITTPKAIASNPECVLKSRLRATGDPFIEVTYKNEQVERISCGDMTVEKVMERINGRSLEMETLASLKTAGFADIKLESSFGGAGDANRETGSSGKIATR